jgi:hypothetical protein
MLFTLGENRHGYKSVRGAGEAAADLADFTLLGEQINDRVPAGCWRCTIASQKGRPTRDAPFPQLLGSTFSSPPAWRIQPIHGDFLHGGQHDFTFGRWGCTRVSIQVTSSVIINSDGSVFDVIAYGLLHQSYDYCCQLADPDIPSVGRTYSLMVKIRTRNDLPHNGHISDHRR